MRKLLIILVLLGPTVKPNAQNLDSLWASWQNESLNDSIRLEAFAEYAYQIDDLDSSHFYANYLDSLGKRRQDSIYWQAKATYINGWAHCYAYEFDLGIP